MPPLVKLDWGTYLLSRFTEIGLKFDAGICPLGKHSLHVVPAGQWPFGPCRPPGNGIGLLDKPPSAESFRSLIAAEYLRELCLRRSIPEPLVGDKKESTVAKDGPAQRASENILVKDWPGR